MADTKFTKGPWHYQENADVYTHIVRDATNWFIASTPQSSSLICEANARLIAAAPELYEAVRKAKQLASIATDWNLDKVEIDGTMVDTYTLHEQFKAALVKAEGEDSHA